MFARSHIVRSDSIHLRLRRLRLPQTYCVVITQHSFCPSLPQHIFIGVTANITSLPWLDISRAFVPTALARDSCYGAQSPAGRLPGTH